jgi:protein-S-isoprenylcysteine O-methyltransferase Ste14
MAAALDRYFFPGVMIIAIIASLQTRAESVEEAAGNIVRLLLYTLVLVLLLVGTSPTRTRLSPIVIAGLGLAFLSPVFLSRSDSELPSIFILPLTAIALFYFSFLVYSYLSLGKNLGVVPGIRSVVTSRAFLVVRHPIYSGSIHLMGCYVIALPSARNIAVLGLFICGLVMRAVEEERLLAGQADYALYSHSAVPRFMSPSLSAPLLLLIVIRLFLSINTTH